MRSAIFTKFYPATDHRPARIKAWVEDDVGTYAHIWHPCINGYYTDYLRSATALAQKLDWKFPLIPAMCNKAYIFVAKE